MEHVHGKQCNSKKTNIAKTRSWISSRPPSPPRHILHRSRCRWPQVRTCPDAVRDTVFAMKFHAFSSTSSSARIHTTEHQSQCVSVTRCGMPWQHAVHLFFSSARRPMKSNNSCATPSLCNDIQERFQIHLRHRQPCEKGVEQATHVLMHKEEKQALTSAIHEALPCVPSLFRTQWRSLDAPTTLHHHASRKQDQATHSRHEPRKVETDSAESLFLLDICNTRRRIIASRVHGALPCDLCCKRSVVVVWWWRGGVVWCGVVVVVAWWCGGGGGMVVVWVWC